MAEGFWEKEARAAEARCENQARTIHDMRYAGNECARVLKDISESPLCQMDVISIAVIRATLARWDRAKTGQDL